jgi:ribosome recycling factor
MSVVANVTQPTPGVMRISPWPATLLPGFEIWLARAEIGLTAERSHNHCRLSLPLASQARRACPPAVEPRRGPVASWSSPV